MSVFNKSALSNGLKEAAKGACLPAAWIAAASIPVVVVGLAMHMPVEDSNHQFFQRALRNWPKRWNSRTVQDEPKATRPAVSVVQANKKYLRNAID